MMTLPQQIITVAMCVLATVLTRFLPFAVFSARKPTPKYIQHLGNLLPGAIFAMLVVYCLRKITPLVVVKKSRHEKYLFLICFFKSRHEEHFCGSCFFKSGHGQ